MVYGTPSSLRRDKFLVAQGFSTWMTTGVGLGGTRDSFHKFIIKSLTLLCVLLNTMALNRQAGISWKWPTPPNHVGA
jgi:hypothetical protein